MKTPGFTAERSLYRASEQYRSALGWSAASRGQDVVPQYSCWKQCETYYPFGGPIKCCIDCCSFFGSTVCGGGNCCWLEYKPSGWDKISFCRKCCGKTGCEEWQLGQNSCPL